MPQRNIYVYASSASKITAMGDLREAYRAFTTPPATWDAFLNTRFRVSSARKYENKCVRESNPLRSTWFASSLATGRGSTAVAVGKAPRSMCASTPCTPCAAQKSACSAIPRRPLPSRSVPRGSVAGLARWPFRTALLCAKPTPHSTFIDSFPILICLKTSRVM